MGIIAQRKAGINTERIIECILYNNNIFLRYFLNFKHIYAIRHIDFKLYFIPYKAAAVSETAGSCDPNTVPVNNLPRTGTSRTSVPVPTEHMLL